MIRGWRNDPRWVEYYAKRDAELAQRRLDRMRFEAENYKFLLQKEMIKNRLQPGTS